MPGAGGSGAAAAALAVAAAAVAAAAALLWARRWRRSSAAKAAAWRAGLLLEMCERSLGWDSFVAGAELVGVEESGLVRMVFVGGPARHLRNFQDTLHGGAAGTLVDVVTTLAMVAGGGAPGVSSNLSVQYLLPIPAGSSFEIEAAVVRRGRRQVVTEAKIWRSSSAMDDSRLAVVATHTKVVTASQAWVFFFIWHLLPKVLVEFWVRHRGGGSSMNSVTLEQRLSTTPTAPGSQPDEQQAKKEYWDRFCKGVGGEGGVDLRGFDSSIEGLRAGGVRESVNRNRGFLDDGRTYSFSFPVEAHSCNFFGMLHGGCIFTLVDCIGTAVIAGAGKAPGVTVNCSVNFLSPAPPGSVVVVEGNVLKVGKTLQFSAVHLYAQRKRSRRFKAIAQGNVIKAAQPAAK